MFGIILLSTITAMQVYVFWRMVSVPFLKRSLSQKAIIGSGIVFWAVFAFGRMYGSDAPAVELFGMNWMGTVFILFIPFFTLDLVTGFGFLLPRLALILRSFAFCAGALLATIALVQGVRPPVVVQYEVRTPGLPEELDGTVIVALSDMHVGSLLGQRWLEGRVAQVQAQQPDLIVLLGDIVEGGKEYHKELLPIFSRLSAPMGVWAVLGNHESHQRHYSKVNLMEEAGFHLLRNRWAEVKPGLVVAGVDDLTYSSRSAGGVDLIGQALTGKPVGTTILLSHTPWQAERAAAAGVALMLSGHTHAGQIWPFGYLVKRIYPLFEGVYEVGDMTAIVSRGTGTWGPRMRLWRPGEILRIVLRKSS